MTVGVAIPDKATTIVHPAAKTVVLPVNLIVRGSCGYEDPPGGELPRLAPQNGPLL